jgi:hypothetical protein
MSWSRIIKQLLRFTPLLVVLLLIVPMVVAANAPGASTPSIAEQDSLMMRVLWWIVSSVFGGLTWATGMLLDYSITQLVVNFGSVYQSTGLGVAVNNLWGVVRDLFNLTFIFGLIYIGFRMIINSDDSGAKKAIVNLIIAALLVNFSLFITKTVIDFSNIAAVQITRVIYQGGTSSNQSISVAFGVQMGLSSLWGQTQEQTNRARIETGAALPPGGVLYIFGAMILFLIAAFAFGAGAILLFVRFIALNIMMILSPIMFLGRVFEPLQSYSSSYWKKFLSYCFFAPAFLLMLYFSLYILGTFTGVMRQTSGLAAELSPGGNSVNAIASLLMSGGFLIASVLVAQKMSIAGSAMTLKVGNNLRGAVKNGMLAAPRFAGRQSIGRFGKYVDGKLENRGFRADSTLRGLAKSATEAKFGGSSSFKSVKDAKKARDQFMARKTAVDNVSKAIDEYTKAGTAATSDQKIAMESAIAGANSEQISKLLGKYKSGTERDTLIANMSASQYDSVMKAKEEDFNDEDKDAIAKVRSAAITQTLVSKGIDAEVTKAKNTAAANARAVAISNGATPADAEAAARGAADSTEKTERARLEKDRKTNEASLLKAGLNKASAEQLKVLGSKTLATQAGGLSLSQVDDIKKSKDYTETEKEQIIGAHKTALVERFKGLKASGNPAEILSGLKDEDVAKLPADILKDSDLTNYLKPGMLTEMRRSLNSSDRATIRAALELLHPVGSNTTVRKYFDSSQGSSF